MAINLFNEIKSRLSQPEAPWILAMAWTLWVWFNALSLEWSINPQYQYGWAVAPITLYWLFGSKQKTGSATQWDSGLTVPAKRTAFLILSLALTAWTPALILNQSHPEWRFTLWALTALTVCFWLTSAYLTGGKNRLNRFLFPVLFLWIGVPWPSQLETPLVQWLTAINATVVAEAMNWLGFPAVARGAIVELANGVVGIEEACTGIRSLQSGLMIAVFCIYEFRLTFRRSVALLSVSLILALGLNLIRTFTLTFGVSKSGAAFYERYHSILGAAVFLSLLGAIFLLAKVLSDPEKSQPPILPDSDPGPPIRTMRIHSSNWFWAIPVALILAEIITFGWFHRPGREWIESPAWTAQWPGAEDPNFRPVTLAEPIRLALRYDQSVAFQWRESKQSIWTFYYFRWKPGHVAARFARNHNPKLCLPANGFVWKRDLGLIPVETDIMTFWFKGYVYELRGREWQVYYGIWEDRAPVPAGVDAKEESDPGKILMNATTDEITRQARIKEAWQGKINPGQRLLEIAIDGAESDESATASLKKNLSQFLKEKND